MKATLPFLFLLFSSVASAQCGGGSSSSSSDDGGSDWTTESTSSDSYGPSGSGEWTPVPIRIGYSYRWIPESYTRYFSADRITQGWNMNAPEHAFDFSYAPGEKERWQIGTRFTYRELGTGSADLRFEPPSNAEYQHPLDVHLYKKASTFSQDLYVDYAPVSLGKHNVRAIVHAAVGYTHLRASGKVTYKDTCGCDQIGASARETSTLLTATLGGGVQLEYAFVGVKALAGYRFQQRSDFLSSGDFDQWQPAFNAEGYDYSGLPANSRFSITGANQTPVESRTDQFFVELTFYFYLGWTHDTLEAVRRRAARQAVRN